MPSTAWKESIDLCFIRSTINTYHECQADSNVLSLIRSGQGKTDSEHGKRQKRENQTRIADKHRKKMK